MLIFYVGNDLFIVKNQPWLLKCIRLTWSSNKVCGFSSKLLDETLSSLAPVKNSFAVLFLSLSHIVSNELGRRASKTKIFPFVNDGPNWFLLYNDFIDMLKSVEFEQDKQCAMIFGVAKFHTFMIE